MSVEDRSIAEAMDVMGEQWEGYDREDPSMDSNWDREMALRLLRAGLLLTDADRAVLDAARYLVTCAGAGLNDPLVFDAVARLCDAVEAQP